MLPRGPPVPNRIKGGEVTELSHTSLP